MASVHRPDGYPFYFAHFRLPVGKKPDGATIWKQFKRSTGKERPDEAMVEAKRIEREEKKKSTFTEESALEVMHLLQSAGKQAARGLLNQQSAQAFLSKLTEISIGEPLVVYTVEKWFSTWLAGKDKSRSRGTYLRYQGIVDGFLASLPERRKRQPLESLTVGDIEAFRDAEIAAGKSASSVNLAVKTVRSVLKRAVPLGLIKANPADAMDSLPEKRIVKSTFDLPAVRALLTAAEGDWKGAILVGYLTGARLGDVTNLQWSSFDFTGRRLIFTAGKTGQSVELPLHESLKAHFEPLVPRDGKGPVFVTLTGKTAGGRNGLSRQFSALLKKAGIQGKSYEAAGKSGRTRNTLTFHSLRHSFNSALANAGVAQEIRMKLTGHLDAKVNSIYTHTELETLRLAIGKLPEITIQPV
ncbi:site-specific recombinase XerD [Roseimicrobium gellanilyticum]|uniref:Site-specific recombinase XerD n=1 Tax=Roseimicrobium gellanilyticum TaxID=748857 RepID=A0A366HFX1_9BACT|nr:site-specific integrase [Roseimicrobium gellanilyticum]RBP41427.1 site-specific recombinase XerD [Roseimicrobium gellanilyticum]